MITIITPAYNNPEQVQKLLESLKSDIEKDRFLEVLVVDDCSRDDSIKKVATDSKFAKYLRLKENQGPAKARNFGAKSAANDILLFVDSDVVFKQDTLLKIKKRFKDDSSLGILCGEYDLEPKNKSFSTTFKAVLARSWIPKTNNITVFVARLGAIKKDIFNSMGGFDDSIRTASSEEWEFGKRLINKGYTIAYDPDIVVKHHFPSFKRQVILLFHRSFMWIYVFKKYRKFDNTCTTPAQAVTQILGFLTVILIFASLYANVLMVVTIIFLAEFIIMDIEFFRLAFTTQGLVFTLLSLPLALILSCAVTLGGVWGFLRFFCIDEIKMRLGV